MVITAKDGWTHGALLYYPVTSRDVGWGPRLSSWPQELTSVAGSITLDLTLYLNHFRLKKRVRAEAYFQRLSLTRLPVLFGLNYGHYPLPPKRLRQLWLEHIRHLAPRRHLTYSVYPI